MQLLVIGCIGGRLDHLAAVLDRARHQDVGAVFVLGNLLSSTPRQPAHLQQAHANTLPGGGQAELQRAAERDRGILGRVFELLNASALSVFVVPGEHDAPLGRLKEIVAALPQPSRIKLVHRTAAKLGANDVVAGLGGTIVEDDHGDDRQLHVHPWEARLAFEHLQGFSPIFQLAQRRVFLFARPPRGTTVDLANGSHVGADVINRIARTYQPHLICCAGPESGRGIEVVEDTRVVNPGWLAARSYALVDLDTLEVRLERVRERVPAVAGAFQTIVVAIDGSPEADRALDLGAALAMAHSARLILMHAFEPVSSFRGEPYLDRTIAERLDRGEHLLQQAAAEVVAVEPQIDLIEGPPADAIVRVAEAQHADLVVMGARGLGGIRGLLGSVSRRVLQQAPCPVLIVHNRRPGGPAGDVELGVIEAAPA